MKSTRLNRCDITLNDQTEKGLTGWRELFEATFKHLPVGLSYLTPDLRHIRLNPFLESRLGIRSEDVAGKHCYDTIGMYKDDPTRRGTQRICDNCGVVAALKTGKPSKSIRRISDTFIVENLGIPVLDKNGGIIGAVEIISDITGQVGMEEGRLKNEASGQDAPPDGETRAEEDFLAMLMHDLKTPLTSITGYVSLILSGEIGSVDNEIRQPMEGIRANAQRMMGLARNFLIAGRLSESAFKLEPEPLELEPLVNDCLKDMEPQIRDKGLVTQATFEPGLPAVLADREHMERVLSNLIANAVKFTPFGGRLTLRAYKADAHVNLELSDTGIGIPTEELPMVFRKYYQGKCSSSSRGTGLGLYIAKSIVEAHRGTITVSSRAGSGATFTISLKPA
jgi:signal transduction histidine kinase